MSAELIDGKKVSQEILEQLKKEAELFTQKGVVPCLAVIRVGDNPASEVYVRKKKELCAAAGLRSLELHFDTSIGQDELLGEIKKLNENEEVHGILVQLPLPKHIDSTVVLESVNPLKDVDCFHPFNVGKLMIGDLVFAPCTAEGIQELLKHIKVPTAGKRVVILGRSNIVGKPLAALLLGRGEYADATVTVCHSKTKNLPQVTAEADILVAAIGQARFVKKEMVKKGAVVIDVGMNRIADPNRPGKTKLVGDVDFDQVKEVASAITPVPGGVGPMTVVMLVKNTLRAAQLQSEK